MTFSIGDIVKYKEGPNKSQYRVTGFYDLFGGVAVTLNSGGEEHVEFEDRLELVSGTLGDPWNSKKSDVVISPAIKNWLSTLPVED